MTDFTTVPVVHTVPGADAVTVERDRPFTADPAPPTFDLYRPPAAAAPCPAVIFVSGYPASGLAQLTRTSLKDWASYVGWARMIAASGIAAITYTGRTADDASTLIRYLRSHADALGLDPSRIGVWACSGHVPAALGVIAHDQPACAALLYGYLLDLDGARHVADAAAQFGFAVPPVTLAELPRALPILVVRAGRDAMPGLEPTLQRFVAAAHQREMAVSLLDHPTGPHAFDLVDDTPETRAVIDGVLAFLRRSLG